MLFFTLYQMVYDVHTLEQGVDEREKAVKREWSRNPLKVLAMLVLFILVCYGLLMVWRKYKASKDGSVEGYQADADAADGDKPLAFGFRFY